MISSLVQIYVTGIEKIFFSMVLSIKMKNKLLLKKGAKLDTPCICDQTAKTSYPYVLYSHIKGVNPLPLR